MPRASRHALSLHRGMIERFSRDADRVFFPREAFPWLGDVERQWRAVAEEVDRLMGMRARIPAFHDVSPRQRGISDERWKTLFLFVYGNRVPEALRACPRTARALACIPGVQTAMFSILEGGTIIPPHRGPLKGVLRLHLGLRVPSDCGMRVGGMTYAWREGEGVVFDDTFEHEAWNRSGEDRVVLFVDFLRPLPPALALVNRAMLAALKYVQPDVREAHRNARRYAAALDTETRR